MTKGQQKRGVRPTASCVGKMCDLYNTTVNDGITVEVDRPPPSFRIITPKSKLLIKEQSPKVQHAFRSDSSRKLSAASASYRPAQKTGQNLSATKHRCSVYHSGSAAILLSAVMFQLGSSETKGAVTRSTSLLKRPFVNVGSLLARTVLRSSGLCEGRKLTSFVQTSFFNVGDLVGWRQRRLVFTKSLVLFILCVLRLAMQLQSMSCVFIIYAACINVIMRWLICRGLSLSMGFKTMFYLIRREGED